MSTTLTQCQELVTAIAAVAAQYVDEEMVVGNLVYREYHPEVAVAADTTGTILNDIGGSLDDGANNFAFTTDGGGASPGSISAGTTDETGAGVSVSFGCIETAAVAPVALMLANPGALENVTRIMALMLAARTDSDLLGLYPVFTTNAAVGTAGTAITDAHILLAAQELDASNIPAAENEARYLVLAKGRTTANASNGNTWDNFLALTNVVNPAIMGTPTVEAEYLNRAPISYRGFHVLPSRFVGVTGSDPATMHNLAFTRSAMMLASTYQLPLNDSTHVQQVSFSNNGDLAVLVMLEFDGTDTPYVALRMVYGAGASRSSYAVQFST